MAESSNGSTHRRELISSYAPVIIWIGVIFFLSTSNGSMSETSRIIEPLLKFLFPSLSPASMLTAHQFIRKAAHVTEYAVLGSLMLRALTRGRRRTGAWAAGIAWIVAAVTASADEFNQSFETSRSSSIWDVGLDCLGGLLGILVCGLIYLFWTRRHSTAIQRSAQE